MSDQIIDEAALLAPLADGDGVGEDPRQDYSATAPYQKLRDARADARAHERNRDAPSNGDERGSTEADVAKAWRDVRRIATDILESKAKDFEVAAWLTESLVRSDGLAGLAAGARLLAGLLEIFWEGGFPRPDEDGLEGRAAPIGGLAGGDTDGTIMQALRRTTLFVRPSGDPLALFQYEAAEDTAGIADEQRREQRYAQGILPFDAIHEESVTGRAALLSLKARAEAAREDWRRLESQLEQRFGSDAPPTRRVAELLNRLIAIAGRLGGTSEKAPAPTNGDTPAGESGGEMPASRAMGSVVPAFGAHTGNAIDRERALQMLEEIAGFFRRTEPHSFLAFTLTDAARRGRMPLPALLAEVLPDEAARTAMLTALGIRPGTVEDDGQGN
jgi:type VI secretion system protein ImpA